MIDRSRDPFYYGDVRVMIFNVPLTTDNDQTEVMYHLTNILCVLFYLAYVF